MELLHHPQDILAWHLAAGVDEAMGEQPVDRYALALAVADRRAAQAKKLLSVAEASPRAGARSSLAPVRPMDGGVFDAAVGKAVTLAASAKTIDDLRTALAGFDGCLLKKTAMNLVFGVGNPEAQVLIIGGVPGEEEDRQGMPFVGPGGQLLDKMLASIGVDRTAVFLSNTVFWRPPGKRHANAGEIAVCLPFVERLIELVEPQILITLGEDASHSLLAQQGGLSRLRAKWYSYETPRMSHPIAACALYHPDFLLTSPALRRQAWQDLLAIQAKISEGVSG